MILKIVPIRSKANRLKAMAPIASIKYRFKLTSTCLFFLAQAIRKQFSIIVYHILTGLV